LSDPAVLAEYGVVPGRWDFRENNPEHFIREAGYPPGVFAVAIPDRPRLLAFDVNSISAAVCMRIDPTPVAIPPNVGARYFRFRCPGAWDSREVVFLDAIEFAPTRGEQLEWAALARPSPLPMPRLTPAGELHDYAAIARTTLLPGQFLISAAGLQESTCRGRSTTFCAATSSPLGTIKFSTGPCSLASLH
jgi:hypothetical protein